MNPSEHMLSLATEFTVFTVPDTSAYDLVVKKTGQNKWGIFSSGHVFDRGAKEFHYQPSASSRGEDYYNSIQYETLDEAWESAMLVVKKLEEAFEIWKSEDGNRCFSIHLDYSKVP